VTLTLCVLPAGHGFMPTETVKLLATPGVTTTLCEPVIDEWLTSVAVTVRVPAVSSLSAWLEVLGTYERRHRHR